MADNVPMRSIFIKIGKLALLLGLLFGGLLSAQRLAFAYPEYDLLIGLSALAVIFSLFLLGLVATGLATPLSARHNLMKIIKFAALLGFLFGGLSSGSKLSDMYPQYDSPITLALFVCIPSLFLFGVMKSGLLRKSFWLWPVAWAYFGFVAICELGVITLLGVLLAQGLGAWVATLWLTGF